MAVPLQASLCDLEAPAGALLGRGLVLPLVLDYGKCYIGGGKGKGRGKLRGSQTSQRSRSPRSTGFAQDDERARIHIPSWQLPGDEACLAKTSVHITIDQASPYQISVPTAWSKNDTEWMVARHLGLRHGWVEYLWLDNDLALEVSDVWPRLELGKADALAKALDAPPESALEGHPTLPLQHISVGVQSLCTVTAFAREHGDLSRR
eukprot:1696561-Amphidinium_carterae.5